MMISRNNITAVPNRVLLYAAGINLTGDNKNTEDGRKFTKKKLVVKKCG
jgi:hypothetical protein